MFFDSHTHYDDDAFAADKHDVIKRVHEKDSVAYLINVGSNIASSIESISFAEHFRFVYAAVGIHPHSITGIGNNTMIVLAGLAAGNKVVAIGEIGLDYHYDFSQKEQQKYWFARQIELAKNTRLPIIIHCRESYDDVMKIIRSTNASETGGVFHHFSGSVESAREVLNQGFLISVAGPVTFLNARRIVEVVRFVPDDMLLIETDCPYLTPEPFRGKRNDSGMIRYIAEKIAEIRQTTVDKIAEMTLQNAFRLFHIEHSPISATGA